MKCQVNLKKMLKVLLNLVYISLICFCLVCIYSNNFTYPARDEEYDARVKLCKSEFSIPVSDLTRLQKSTTLKFWRSRGKFTCDGNTLFYNEKKLILLQFYMFIILLISFLYVSGIKLIFILRRYQSENSENYSDFI